MTNPEYIGDGVYAQVDEISGLCLTTGNHWTEETPGDNVIILEPEILKALEQYIAKQRALKIML